MNTHYNAPQMFTPSHCTQKMSHKIGWHCWELHPRQISCPDVGKVFLWEFSWSLFKALC